MPRWGLLAGIGTLPAVAGKFRLPVALAVSATTMTVAYLVPKGRLLARRRQSPVPQARTSRFFLCCFTAWIAMLLILHWRTPPSTTLSATVGPALVVLGSLPVAEAATVLGTSWTDGPALPEAGLRLLTHGPYAPVRHPLYLGSAIAITGLGACLTGILGLLSGAAFGIARRRKNAAQRPSNRHPSPLLLQTGSSLFPHGSWPDRIPFETHPPVTGPPSTPLYPDNAKTQPKTTRICCDQSPHWIAFSKWAFTGLQPPRPPPHGSSPSHHAAGQTTCLPRNACSQGPD